MMKNILEDIGTGKVPVTFMSKEEILKCFAGIGQTEIPTKAELKEGKQPPHGISGTRKGILVANRKTPSRTYLPNINHRILKADKLWKKLWMHERGELLKAMGITNEEEITELANSTQTPDKVIDYFIMNKNQPKEFHRTQHEETSTDIVLYQGETTI